jgi:hypothetical protein
MITNKPEVIQEGLRTQQTLMTPESISQMMLTPGEGVILVEESDIFEIVYNNPQKLKILITKMWDYTHKTISMD